MERIQKRIAASGYCSRRKAEELITSGVVTVNGATVTELGTKVGQNDVIYVSGELIEKAPKKYYVLYKPEGYISTTDDEKQRRTVIDLIDTEVSIYPVGRLDYDTSGVLLLTNDGDFNQAMIHPKNSIEKVYEVTIKGFLRKETSYALMRGIKLDGTKTKPAKITQVKTNVEKATTKCLMTITEGRYHQVKRMFEAFNHEVIKLKRVRFGTITLDNLKKGEYRLLKPHEYKTLMQLTGIPTQQK